MPTPAATVAALDAATAAKSNHVAAVPAAIAAPKATPTKAAKGAKGTKAAPAITGKTQICYEPGVQSLKLSEIDTTQTNVTRPEGVDDDLQVLVEQIEALGQQTPIIVQRVKGGKHQYRLCAGYRRFAAIAQLQLGTIEARIETTGTDEARVLVNITENENSRKAVSPLGQLAAVEALVALGHPLSQVGILMGRAEDVVRDLMRISKGAEEVRAALALPEGTETKYDGEGKFVSVGHVSWGVARLVLRVAKEEQAKVLRAVSTKSVEGARAWLKDYRERLSGGKAEVEGDEGEGEGTATKAAREEDATYPEGRVVRVTVPFLAKLNTVASDLDAAVKEMAAAALALDAAGIAKAQKSIERAHAALLKAGETQYGALESLFGEKAFKAFVKAAKD